MFIVRLGRPELRLDTQSAEFAETNEAGKNERRNNESRIRPECPRCDFVSRHYRNEQRAARLLIAFSMNL